MTQSNDLTRWNRAGLSRFRYVDGNAVTYLETLRQLMIEQFTDPDSGKLQWDQLRDAIPVPNNEQARERQQRWLKQYHSERRDFAWEILRTFSRSTHVLTEHLDAYANETYLSTATQWDNVRKLVEMLDYHPAPPASASTTIALTTKDDKTGTLETGFKVKNQPDDGSAPVIFETLEDVKVDQRLNKLYLKDWNKSQKLFEYKPCTTYSIDYCAVFPIDKKPPNVSVGTLGILIIDQTPVPVNVIELTDSYIKLKGSAPEISAKRHQVHLLLNPEEIQTPLISGDNVIELNSNHSLVANDLIAWHEDGEWYAAKVEAVDRNRIAVTKGNKVPSKDVDIYRLNFAKKQSFINRIVLPIKRDRNSDTVWDETANVVSTEKIKTEELDTEEEVYDYIGSASVTKAFFLPAKSKKIGIVKKRPVQELEFEGSPGDLASGQWIIASGKNGIQARIIASIEEKENSYIIKFSSPISDKNATIYANFSEQLRPLDYDKNEDVIHDTSQKSDSHTVLPLELNEFPDSLEKGRKLIIKNSTSAFEVKIVEVDETIIKVCPPIPGTELTPSNSSNAIDFLRFDTVILGNIVDVGHGETQPETILGNGDATKSNQTFLFEVEEVSFIKDMTQSSGVRADISISINGRTWQQVASLNDASPTDPHYVVRMTEDGYLQIKFGDGNQGRRLPTGTNNVRINYRTGVGKQGNLSAQSLVKEVKPHKLIDIVEQPLVASGGNAMESINSLRDNAPASVLTLQRAVSLADFKHLAASHSSIWQAHAYRVPTGLARHDSIKVAVVPAGGGELGDLAEELTAFLKTHALPGVQVEVVNFSSVILNLDITIRVKTTEYDADEVVNSTQSALLSAFSLEKSQLGQPLFRSQLYEVVEAVSGVENSVCIINPNSFIGVPIEPRRVAYGADGVVRSVQAHQNQVIYLDETQTQLTVTVAEFSL